MADEYIKVRMQQWAEWLLQRESGGLGFPSECSYTRMQQRSDSSGCISPNIDVDAMQVEDAVRELPSYLRDTARAFYVAPGTIEQKAKALRCHRDTVYARIEKVHVFVLNCLALRPKKIA